MYYGYGGNAIDELNGFMDTLTGIMNTVGGLATFHNIIGFILGIGVAILCYIVYSYIYMFQGRKVGLNNDWFAYIPIVRTIYRIDMIGEARWKMIFIGGVASIIKLVLFFILFCFLESGSTIMTILFDIIVLAFFGVCLFINYGFNRKFYARFNFNEHFALVDLTAGLAALLSIICLTGGFIPLILFGWWLPLGIISLSKIYTGVFDFITAFDNRCVPRNVIDPNGSGKKIVPKTNAGKMVCTAGMYKDAVFDVESDFEMIIGRDSYFSSIVINEGADNISRKHCGIRYNKSTKDYTITDYSSNGTYIADTKERLKPNTPKTLPKGTSIYLGNMNNRFKLL